MAKQQAVQIETDWGIVVRRKADMVYIEQNDDEMIFVTRARLPWLIAALQDMERALGQKNYHTPHA